MHTHDFYLHSAPRDGVSAICSLSKTVCLY